MKASILVPYRPEPWRDTLLMKTNAAIAEVMRLLVDRGDEAELITVDDFHEHEGLFNHPQAINRAASLATGDVYLIWDADTIPLYPAHVVDAIRAVWLGGHWRLPATYVQLTEEATKDVLAGGPLPHAPWTDEAIWVGDRVSWSGIVVVAQEAFWLVGGADERYKGWGADDVALAAALATLTGPVVRWDSAVLHLWHPRGDQETGNHRFNADGNRLAARYNDAWGNAAKMEKLIAQKPPARKEG